MIVILVTVNTVGTIETIVALGTVEEIVAINTIVSVATVVWVGTIVRKHCQVDIYYLYHTSVPIDPRIELIKKISLLPNIFT